MRVTETVATTAQTNRTCGAAAVPGGDAEAMPRRVGRFTIEQRLGRGGFATVYLAKDPDLQRLVALKLPRLDKFAAEDEIRRYLSEARAAARMKHPRIVTVYDVNQDAGQPYIVLEYIAGESLQQLLDRRRLTPWRAVELMIEVADAVQHAHQRGLVHRDLKPGNVLLSQEGNAYITDFGLAVHESYQRLKLGEIAGTPRYMAPEQVLGETHRLDQRTDIWSLGVMLCRMLCGGYPLDAKKSPQLFERILEGRIRTPRQIDERVPAELERICLKCLSRQMSQRYQAAAELIEELSGWQQQADWAPPFLDDPPSGAGASGDSQSTITEVSSSASGPIALPPQGLRPLGAGQAEWLPELLADPLDRAGLPESIRFWTSHAAQTEGQRTFPVGLLYGPSGCGKTSLMRAGLLARLPAEVHVEYVEAWGEGTERRLLQTLQSHCPALRRERSLAGALMLLREQRCLPDGKRKLLLVLDQFEQWLRANGPSPATELVQALRQCDGGTVQAIIVVRDEAWLATSRLFRTLDLAVVQGRNSALVDQVGLPHAVRILRALGRGCGALPAAEQSLSEDQQAFLRRSVEGLVDAGRVAHARLVMFAQMFRHRPWSLAELESFGSLQPIGVRYLETLLGQPAGTPWHRNDPVAIEAVLCALLHPETADLKGPPQPYQTLLDVSGYARRPERFDRLLHLLGDSLQLITTAEPAVAGQDATEQDDPAVGPRRSDRVMPRGHRWYQLTHDCLAPAVRQWVDERRRRTRRGQYEMRLAERTALWSARRERKQLPTLWEWIGIGVHTRLRSWTGPQRRMMAAATGCHLSRLTIALIAILLVLGGAREFRGRFQATAAVDRLLTAETIEVPQIVAELTTLRRWSEPLLAELAEARGLDRRSDLRVRVARFRGDAPQLEPLLKYLLVGTPQEVRLLSDTLTPQPQAAAAVMWSTLADPEQPVQRRLRAACALARWEPEAALWNDQLEPLAGWLLTHSPIQVSEWAALLRPISDGLRPTLQRAYQQAVDNDARSAAAVVLADFLAEDPDGLVDLIQQAHPDQLRFITAGLPHLDASITDTMLGQLADDRDAGDPDDCCARANVAIALLKAGRPEALWPLLEPSGDPSVRSYLIQRIADAGVDADLLIQRLDKTASVGQRRALQLSLGRYDWQAIPQGRRRTVARHVSTCCADDPDPGVHAASRWLLQQMQAEQMVEAIFDQQAGQPPTAERAWWINSQRQAMTLVDAPVTFTMGASESEQGRPAEEQQRVRIDCSFAIAMTVVTIGQFQQYQRTTPAGELDDQQLDLPVKSSMYEAMQYCNWLSRQAGIAEDQLCYRRVDRRMEPVDDMTRRFGYRLPTEAEWEYTCRAGSNTAYHFGSDPSLLALYAWGLFNTDGTTQPVARLMPNDFGLFDCYGNMQEWCHNSYAEDQAKSWSALNRVQVLRGSSVRSREPAMRSATRAVGNASMTAAGFRVARTVDDLTNLIPNDLSQE